MNPIFRNIFNVLFVAMALSGFSSARAADYYSARSAALGGAGHAGPLLNDATYMNPSFGSFLPAYAIGLNYNWFQGGELTPDGSRQYHGKVVNAAVMDGRSEYFQAGFGYTLNEAGKFLHLGVSKSLFSKRFSIGLGAKYLAPSDASQAGLYQGSVSASFIVSDWLQLSAIVDNVLENNASVNNNLLREMTVGSKINIMGIVLAYYDPHLIPSLPSAGIYGHEMGLEFPMMKDFFLRVGAFQNSKVPALSEYGNGYGTGAGWIAPRISIDYGVSRVIEPKNVTSQTVSLTAYF